MMQYVIKFLKGVLLGATLVVVLYTCMLGVKFFWYTEVKGYVLTMPPGGYGETMHKVQAYTIVGASIREAVQCEFEEPLKYLTLINHWYDTNEEMYADYLLLADPAEHDEIWGWSDCVWQPDDSWAACDVYVVKPDFVHADMNIDTIGHEVLHGSCGDYHE